MDQAFMDSMSDEIGEQLAAAGQTKVPIVTCTIEGELSEADVGRYVEKAGDLPAQKSDEKDLASLRAKHHQVARLLAAGLPEGIVAQLTGYTTPWISTLKNNPSMIELVSHYRAPGDNATKMIAEKLRFLADMSLEKAIEKIAADEADMNQLLAAIKLGADRSNNGPMAKLDIGVTHSLDEDQVRKIAESARRVNQERIIDITAVRKALPAPEPKDNDAAS